jgi:hypothetical protein
MPAKVRVFSKPLNSAADATDHLARGVRII